MPNHQFIIFGNDFVVDLMGCCKDLGATYLNVIRFGCRFDEMIQGVVIDFV